MEVQLIGQEMVPWGTRPFPSNGLDRFKRPNGYPMVLQLALPLFSQVQEQVRRLEELPGTMASVDDKDMKTQDPDVDAIMWR